MFTIFTDGPKPMGADEDDLEDDDLFEGILVACQSPEYEEPAPAPRRRGRALEDRSSIVPQSCILRKYRKADGTEYWHGSLPPGVTDADGHRSRMRTWARTGFNEM